MSGRGKGGKGLGIYKKRKIPSKIDKLISVNNELKIVIKDLKQQMIDTCIEKNNEIKNLKSDHILVLMRFQHQKLMDFNEAYNLGINNTGDLNEDEDSIRSEDEDSE